MDKRKRWRDLFIVAFERKRKRDRERESIVCVSFLTNICMNLLRSYLLTCLTHLHSLVSLIHTLISAVYNERTSSKLNI